MIEVKIFDNGKPVREQAGDYILLFSADNKNIETFSTGEGPDMDKTFTGIADQLAEIIAELGKEAEMPWMWTEDKIETVANRIMLHGKLYAAKIYLEETNEGSGKSMGAGVEPGEH